MVQGAIDCRPTACDTRGSGCDLPRVVAKGGGVGPQAAEKGVSQLGGLGRVELMEAEESFSVCSVVGQTKEEICFWCLVGAKGLCALWPNG